MAKLVLPKKAYRDTKYGDGKWHLAYWHGEGPLMLCGTQIYHQVCEEKPVKELDISDLCIICMGPFWSEASK